MTTASRAATQIVLLDNKFATLPHVVAEGRHVIGNIERVSNLFLTKTVYSVLLAILVGLAGLASELFGTDSLLFPFQPIHVTIAAWFTSGIPAFFLSLAPNNERAHPGFVRRVMTSALLAVVARPYQLWRVALVLVSALAYVVICSIPMAQRVFMLDSSNVAITSMALVIVRWSVSSPVVELGWTYGISK